MYVAKRVQEVKSPRSTSVLKHGQVSREIVGSLHSQLHNRGIEGTKKCENSTKQGFPNH